MLDVKNCFTYAYSAGTAADFEQAICNAGAAEASTNLIDLGVDGVDLVGDNLPYLVVKSTEICAGTGTTLTITLENDTAVGFNTALKQVFSTGAIPKARTTAGTILVNQQLPAGRYSRYMRLMFTGDNTFETTGKVVAYLAASPEPNGALLDQV